MRITDMFGLVAVCSFVQAVKTPKKKSSSSKSEKKEKKEADSDLSDDDFCVEEDEPTIDFDDDQLSEASSRRKSSASAQDGDGDGDDVSVVEVKSRRPSVPSSVTPKAIRKRSSSELAGSSLTEGPLTKKAKVEIEQPVQSSALLIELNKLRNGLAEAYSLSPTDVCSEKCISELVGPLSSRRSAQNPRQSDC